MMMRILGVLLFTNLAAGVALADEPLKLSSDVVVKIPKPEVTYVLAKQDLTPKYELELKESFLPQVVQAVEQKPF